MSRHILLTVFLTWPIACARLSRPTPGPPAPGGLRPARLERREYTSDLHENAAGGAVPAGRCGVRTGADGPMVLMKWRDLCAPDKDNRPNQADPSGCEDIRRFSTSSPSPQRKEGVLFQAKIPGRFPGPAGRWWITPDIVPPPHRLFGAARRVPASERQQLRARSEDVLSLLGGRPPPGITAIAHVVTGTAPANAKWLTAC